MAKHENLVFVDVEASGGISPASGVMTEFGAVHYGTRKAFHGVLFPSVPSAENPAVSTITGPGFDAAAVMAGFASWLKVTVPNRPVFVSDNVAYDFQWVNFEFDKHLGENPFGHSGRRISDFWAGLNHEWSNTQKWKKFRRTPHDHNPVNDAMGNVEAFETIMEKLDKLALRL
jgi:hypothetical protein